MILNDTFQTNGMNSNSKKIKKAKLFVTNEVTLGNLSYKSV